MNGRNCWALGLGWALVASALAPGPAAEDREASRRMGIQPVPVYTPLPGRAIGVIVLEPRPVLAWQRRFGPGDVACFGSGPGSYRFFSIPAKGEEGGDTRSFVTGVRGDEKLSIDNLCLATARTLRPEITEPFTLVQVEVNRGAGSGPESSFAATEIKKLGPSEGYPIRVTETVRDREARYRRERLPELLREELAKAERALEPRLKGAGPRVERRSDEQTLTHVTWLEDRKRLHVCFLTIVHEGKYLKGRGTEPSRKPDPTSGEMGRYGVAYRIETGWVYEFSADGEETLSQPLRPIGGLKTLNPPASAGPAPPAPSRGSAPPGPSGPS